MIKSKRISSISDVSIGDSILIDNYDAYTDAFSIISGKPYKVIDKSTNHFGDGTRSTMVYIISECGYRKAMGAITILSWRLVDKNLNKDESYLEGLIK